MSRTRIALLAVALAPVLAGCGAAVDRASEAAAEKVVEKAVESEIGGDVDIERDGDGFSIETEDGSMTVDGEGNMVIEGEDGTMTMETGEELADDFPDIPLPGEMSIESTSRVDSGDGTALHIVSAVMDADAESTFDAYTSALEDAGFTIDMNNVSNSEGEFYGMVLASKGESLQVTTVLVTEDSGTRVQLSASVLDS